MTFGLHFNCNFIVLNQHKAEVSPRPGKLDWLSQIAEPNSLADEYTKGTSYDLVQYILVFFET